MAEAATVSGAKGKTKRARAARRPAGRPPVGHARPVTSDAADRYAQELPEVLDSEAAVRAQLRAIDQVRVAKRALDQAAGELAAAVRAAKQAGVSWARVGVATGITAEGARRRWLEPHEVDDLL